MVQGAETSNIMSCPACSGPSKRFGKHRNGLQRFRCGKCGKTFTEGYRTKFHVEKLFEDPMGLLAIQLLVEGSAIRVAERITGLHRNTIIKLLIIAGQRCEKGDEPLRPQRSGEGPAV
jgi:transposase-like protein